MARRFLYGIRLEVVQNGRERELDERETMQIPGITPERADAPRTEGSQDPPARPDSSRPPFASVPSAFPALSCSRSSRSPTAHSRPLHVHRILSTASSPSRAFSAACCKSPTRRSPSVSTGQGAKNPSGMVKGGSLRAAATASWKSGANWERSGSFRSDARTLRCE